MTTNTTERTALARVVFSTDKQPSEAPQQSLFGMTIDAIDMPVAIERLHRWIEADVYRCRFVVTPNVDHAVLFQQRADLRAAYENASMVLADGHPIVWASRLLRKALPERVPGSDLVPQFFADCQNRGKALRVFLLGAAPGVGIRAAENIRKRWPKVEIVGIYSPPLGFEKSDEENDLILAQIALARPDLLILGLGAPKQECWVNEHFEKLQTKVALCVGATIDFLAGEKKRAPRWVQRLGLEWCHRMITDPKRLVKRYAIDAWVFPQLVWRQMFSKSFPGTR